MKRNVFRAAAAVTKHQKSKHFQGIHGFLVDQGLLHLLNESTHWINLDEKSYSLNSGPLQVAANNIIICKPPPSTTHITQMQNVHLKRIIHTEEEREKIEIPETEMEGVIEEYLDESYHENVQANNCQTGNNLLRKFNFIGTSQAFFRRRL